MSGLAVLFLNMLAPAYAAAYLPKDKLSPLERHFFAHDYADRSVNDRLDRLEKLVFGQVKTGSATQRLAQLVKALPAPERLLTEGAGNKQNLPASGRQPAMAKRASGLAPGKGTYPAVTKLENLILGKSHADDAITCRLDRLERQAFGQASGSPDMSERVDRLKTYAGLNAMAHDDDFLPPATSGRWSASTPARNTSLIAMVNQLEYYVFGKSYLYKSLIERVKDLEQAVSLSSISSMSMPARIDRLRQAIGAVPGPDNYSASALNRNTYHSFTSTYNSAVQGGSPSHMSSIPPATPAAASQLKGRHRWLHGIGKALATAGLLALDAVSSVASYSGGYYSGSYYSGSYPYYASGSGMVPTMSSRFGFGSGFGSSFGMAPAWGGGFGYGAAPLGIGGRYF